ncbi:hypothetical protein LVD15_17880 [Fulvivirga maritima]|uniref:hypothetical protein n=1 Tax=Fulvivirga maritima TaxID=2904247 RepID=UPI001F2FF5CA|nr:hypothetical protein [Fulvivirga maritima]UII25166.1 hypothetical protein LVD15_17880 [Fulvivirga maritima]
MLRFLKRAAIVMLLLLLALYLYLQLRQSRSYNNIPEGAQIVMRANIDQLFKKLLFNSITNPKYYYQSSSDSTETDEEEAEDPSFVIPANVFVYNLKTTPNSFYTSLHIKDSAGMQAFFKKELSIDEYQPEENYTYGTTDNRQLQVIYNENMAFVAFSFDRENVKSQLHDLLFNLTPMDRNTPTITALRDAESDVSLFGENSEVTIDFNTGEVSISGLANLHKYLEIPQQTQVKQNLDSMGLHAWLSATPTAELDTLFTINHVTLSGEKLNSYYRNGIDLQIAGTTVQQDTIINYEYNDDFEKVEQKEINTSRVPGISLAVQCEADSMQKYLQNKGIFKNGQVNESFFPLYHLNTSKKDSLLIISNLATDLDAEYSASENLIGLYVDFNKLQAQIPILENRVSYLSVVELYGTKENDNVKLNGSIKMTQSDLNSLIQFIKK